MIEDGTRMGDRKWINRKKRSNRERKSKDECKTLRGGRRKRSCIGRNTEEERETAVQE